MSRASVAALITSISLCGADLPALSEPERANAKNNLPEKSPSTNEKEKSPAMIAQAIEEYCERFREIYRDNGKPETLLSTQMSRFDEAAKHVAKALDSAFDPTAFCSLSIVDKVNYLSLVFHRHGYILGNLDVTAEAADGSRAVLSVTLDRVLASENVDTGELAFATIGLSKSPLPATLPLFDTSSVICEAEGIATLAPLSVLGLDLTKKTYALVLGHDTVTKFLPGYDHTKGDQLNPAVRTFLTNWAVGRLAFHSGGEAQVCSLPQSINFENHMLPLRSVMGLVYAFEQGSDDSPQLATIVCNYIGISGSLPDNQLLDLSSRLIRERLEASFPGINDFKDAQGGKLFFDQHPKAAKAYLRALREMVKQQVEAIKDEVLKRDGAARQRFSI